MPNLIGAATVGSFATATNRQAGVAMTVQKVELPKDQSSLGTNAKGITINQVAFDAPWRWLDKGWIDLWKNPQMSLGYGALFAVAAIVLLLTLTQLDWVALMLPLAGGFLLVGPLLAIGLYEASRRLEVGEEVKFSSICSSCKSSAGQIAFMGVVLLLVFFAWMEIAFLMFMLFMGTSALPHASEFIPTLLFTGRGLGLLVFGTIAGGLLAVFVFAISVVSVPLIMVKKIDVVSAAATSVAAVRKNPKAMLLWAVIIAALMLFGIVTLFAGLIVVFPLIGHATWHAFRDVIDLE